jgi:hypothetical protein
MRDIVATIQPDQDEIVRADLEETLVTQVTIDELVLSPSPYLGKRTAAR